MENAVYLKPLKNNSQREQDNTAEPKKEDSKSMSEKEKSKKSMFLGGKKPKETQIPDTDRQQIAKITQHFQSEFYDQEKLEVANLIFGENSSSIFEIIDATETNEGVKDSKVLTQDESYFRSMPQYTDTPPVTSHTLTPKQDNILNSKKFHDIKPDLPKSPIPKIAIHEMQPPYIQPMERPKAPLHSIPTIKPIPPKRSSSLQPQNRINTEEDNTAKSLTTLGKPNITDSHTPILTLSKSNINSPGPINLSTQPQKHTQTTNITHADILKSLTPVGKELVAYFLVNDIEIKNRRLARMQTKAIQMDILHILTFKTLAGCTLEEFLLIINGHMGKMPCFHKQSNNSAYESERLDSLSYSPKLHFTPQEYIHDNSNVFITQIYATKYLNMTLTINGTKTYPSNNPLKEIPTFSTDYACGINRNIVTIEFANTMPAGGLQTKAPFINPSITINTTGSYRKNNPDTILDAEQLLAKIIYEGREGKNQSNQIVDIRFLKSFGHDQKIYYKDTEVMGIATTESIHNAATKMKDITTNKLFGKHKKNPDPNTAIMSLDAKSETMSSDEMEEEDIVMSLAAQKKEATYNKLWLNSLGMGTSIIASIAPPETKVKGIVDILDQFDIETLNPKLKAHINYTRELIKCILTSKDFYKRGASRLVFGLLVIFISVMPKDKQPTLLAGCMSAKDRTGAFIFCALIISTIFFHRVFSGKYDYKKPATFKDNSKSKKLFSFIFEFDKFKLPNIKGKLIDGALDNEELDLIKAMLNNPILYNILSKLGIGEYNNKNLDIISGFLKNYPELLKLMIEEPLIHTGA